MCTKTDKAIDNASSVLVTLLLMDGKYRIKYKGVTIECDTRDDAMRLVDKIHQSDATTQWTLSDFEEFTNRIGVVQRNLLNLLLISYPVPVNAEELRAVLDLPDNRVLAGVLSGVSKQALALNMEPADVYSQKVSYKSGKPRREYMANPGFRKMAQDNEWPSEKDLGKK